MPVGRDRRRDGIDAERRRDGIGEAPAAGAGASFTNILLTGTALKQGRYKNIGLVSGKYQGPRLVEGV